MVAVLNIVPDPAARRFAAIIARFLRARAREVYPNLEQYGALFMLVIFFILPAPIYAFVRRHRKRDLPAGGRGGRLTGWSEGRLRAPSGWR